MNSFYLRLLLAFLIANFIVLGVSVVGTRFLLESSSESQIPFDPIAMQALLYQTYVADGPRGVEELSRRYRAQGLSFQAFVNGDARGRPGPRPLRKFVDQLDLSQRSRIALPGPGEFLWSLPLAHIDEIDSVTIVVHQHPAGRRGRDSGPGGGDRPRGLNGPGGRAGGPLPNSDVPTDMLPFPGVGGASFAIYLGLLVVGIALAGWIVARNLTAPLRSVQTTINRFAHGDLSARVGEHLTSRGDDMGRLAGDFDRMANGVEKMIGSRDRLLHQLSHEMRSPLARLRFAIELARGQNTGDDVYLVKADREIDRLNGLMDEMLQMARAERLPNERQAQDLSLDVLLDDAIERATLVAQARNIAIVRHAASDVTFAGQGDLLERALDNVLGNAVKFSPPGGRITVDAAFDEKLIRIGVADQGPGVPANELDELFEPFYRASNTGEEGYGLGLAIVASALRAHGGKAKASLGTGGGLIVTMEIPRAG